MELKDIVSKFDLEGEVLEISPLGNGLINDTYKVHTSDGAPDYVLQKINDTVFTDIDLLQHNIEAVTGHIREKLEAAGEADIDRKVLKFIPAKETGKTYAEADGKFWRISVFIPDTYTYETVTPEYSYLTGKAFGNFEAMLSDLQEPLGETIPNFHNMEFRMSQLIEAVENDKFCRIDDPEEGDSRHPIDNDPDHSDEVIAMIDEIDENSIEMCKAEQMFRDGVLPKRICHCDTKVNNMLFDEEGHVLCVIDLDTVMPSLFYSDYGDFLRSAANTVAEDSPEFDRIDVRMDIFEAFTRGYIESASAFLTPLETELLPYAAALFPYMQAVRFLWDYLNGDVYWKTTYPTHNLVRAQNQWHLFLKVREHEAEMKAFIASLG